MVTSRCAPWFPRVAGGGNHVAATAFSLRSSCAKRAGYQFRAVRRMLHWTVVFLVIALIAALFGFSGIAASAAGIARVLFTLFLILFALSLIASLLGVRAPLL